MKKFLALITVFLVGCAGTNVARHFPEVPSDLQKPCLELELVSTTTNKLSDVIGVVTDNYAEYHLCRIRVDAWIEWHKTQRTIFEEVK